MILRPMYVDRLISYRDMPVIKVITGMRRCGKSSIMSLFKDYLLDDGVPEKNIVNISFELMEFEDITDYKKMYDYIKSKIPAEGKTYILLDEMQMIPKWEKAVNSLFAENVADIYLTGSNSELLSSEIATLLSGRYVTIQVYPLSFQEYLEFSIERKQKEKRTYNSLKRIFRKGLDQQENIALDVKRYVRFGALPTIPFLPQEKDIVLGFLQGVYTSVILRDILYNRESLDLPALKKVIRFIAQNTGSLLNAQYISDALLSKYNDPLFSVDRMLYYISVLKKAYILYREDCFDIESGSIDSQVFKYYIADTGIRNMVLLFSDTGKGHNLETIVYLELVRRGYQVYCGKYKDAEIDFFITRRNVKKCIQVVINLEDEDSCRKKLRDLDAIPQDCQKYIISLNRNFVVDNTDVKCLNFAEFLLNPDYDFEGEFENTIKENLFLN